MGGEGHNRKGFPPPSVPAAPKDVAVAPDAAVKGDDFPEAPAVVEVEEAKGTRGVDPTKGGGAWESVEAGGGKGNGPATGWVGTPPMSPHAVWAFI